MYLSKNEIEKNKNQIQALRKSLEQEKFPKSDINFDCIDHKYINLMLN